MDPRRFFREQVPVSGLDTFLSRLFGEQDGVVVSTRTNALLGRFEVYPSLVSEPPSHDRPARMPRAGLLCLTVTSHALSITTDMACRNPEMPTWAVVARLPLASGRHFARLDWHLLHDRPANEVHPRHHADRVEGERRGKLANARESRGVGEDPSQDRRDSDHPQQKQGPAKNPNNTLHLRTPLVSLVARDQLDRQAAASAADLVSSTRRRVSPRSPSSSSRVRVLP